MTSHDKPVGQGLHPLPEARPEPVPRIESTVLFAGKREVVIVHEQEAYRLRITRQKKLILTK